MSTVGKRTAGSLGRGRVSLLDGITANDTGEPEQDVNSTDRRPGLDLGSLEINFMLAAKDGDVRPYLRVKLCGVEVTALLDSGATRTVFGKDGHDLARRLGLPVHPARFDKVTVANGNSVEIVGCVSVPFELEGRVCHVDVIIVPEITDVLLLGSDFIRAFGIVPNLSTGNWCFNGQRDGSLCVLNPQSQLSVEQSRCLEQEVGKMFASMGDGLGCSVDATHMIRLKEGQDVPIKQRYYPVSPTLQRQIDHELDEMLQQGVVEPSRSAWSSPILLVKKKDNSYRFCVDYRKLNGVTVRDAYPLPYVSDTLDKLRNARFLSSLDIKSAYWQIPMEEQSKQYTAFTVPKRGLFQFLRMPFGLTNAPATWQRLIDNVLGADLEPHVFVYLDDIIIVTETFELHLEVLLEVLRRVIGAGLRLSKEKCRFCRSELRYLGYIVNDSGLHVDPEKVEAMMKVPTPKNVKEVRQFLGVVSWYRRFVENFATLVSPLTSLLKKNRKFIWDSDCENAFSSARQKLVSAPILACPDYGLPFLIQTDASDFGLGAVLAQRHEDGEKVICYLSRSLTKEERKYSVTEKECLAVLWAIEKLRPYIEGERFTVITDHHSLVWLQNLKEPTGRLARWAVRLQQYDFEIIHRRGKDHVVPDCLSRSVPVVNSFDVRDTKDEWYLDLKRRISSQPDKFPGWRIENNLIYKYTEVPFPALSEDIDYWKIVVPKDWRRDVMKRNHDEPTAGHCGVYKTFERVKSKFYWPKMKADIRKYIRGCTVCQAIKPELKRPAGLMSSRTTVMGPWQLLSADLIGPLPRSTSGHQYILTVVDYFTKFALFFPLRTATTSSVLRVLEDQVFLLFGAPKWFVCDNGPQFKSHQFQNLLKSYGITVSHTAHYHPQADPAERFNQTVETMLRAYAADNHRLWDKNLAKIGCAIRTSVHEVTRFTPYFATFGREISLNAGNVALPSGGIQVSSRDDVLQRSKAFEQLTQDIRSRMKRAAERSKQRYDLRRRDVRYDIGDLVWRRNFPLSNAANYFSAKLAPKYVGPFKISKRVSPWSYELNDMNGRHSGTWHAKDLKPYVSRDESTSE